MDIMVKLFIWGSITVPVGLLLMIAGLARYDRWDDARRGEPEA